MSDFVHLHVHTDYSLLDGAAQVEPLIDRAKDLGFTALAITDHGNLFGAIDFAEQCKKRGVKPLIGCEFYVAGGSRLERTGTEQGNHYYHLILIAKNTEGYRNLMVMSSRSYIEGFYYKPRIDEELLREHSGGLICLTACIAGELPQLLLARENDKALAFVERYKALFGPDNFYIELQDHGLAEQRRVKPLLIELAAKTGVPLVVTNDSHYVNKEDWEAHEVLLRIGRQEKLTAKDPLIYGAKEFYLKSEEEMAALFPDRPETMTNTRKIADMCQDDIIPTYEPGDLKNCLPDYQIPAGFENADAYLRHLVYQGLETRYPSPDGGVQPEIRERAEYELGVITSMGFTGYFLIVWDFIAWSKQQDIPIGPGRGSGAGSIVAYAMGITNMDPLRFNLIFERFLNPERISMPDFDIDMSDEGRQAVIDYTRQKYGDDQVGHIVTFTTLKAKAVIKDVGRVLDVPLSDVNMLTKLVPDNPKTHLKDAFEVNPDIQGSGQLAPYRHDEKYERLFDLCFKLEDCHRNTSLHASGIVIGKTTLLDWAPLLKDSKTGKIATQYTMNQIEGCGLVKMDYLGLKTLSIIKRTEELIRKKPGFENFSAEHIDEQDAKTFDLFCKGKTSGFFQFESPGMQKWLRQLKPSRIEDIIAMNALYRPGPMDNIPDFVVGKFDHSKVRYPDPCLKDILEETYGIMVYQEQVMQVAQRIAGYTMGRADVLRKAMGKKKRDILDAEKKPFIEGAVKKGFAAEHAGEIFEIMAPFAGYGFNKSHAAAYSILAYQTAYLKAHFSAEFVAAKLTNEITGANDKLAEYIEEGRSMGLVIESPDINCSGKIFEVSGGKIIFGLTGIKGLGDRAAEEIIASREKDGPYKNFSDFLDRLDLHTVNKKALEVLVKTGCFDKLGQSRKELWENLEKAAEYAERKKADSSAGQASLFGDAGEQEYADFAYTRFDDWTVMEKLAQEKELIGCYVSGHPLDDYRPVISKCASMTAGKLADALGGRAYTVIGQVRAIKEITTKKGAPMAFVTLDDLEGSIELVLFPKMWEKCRNAVQENAVLAFSGKVDASNPDKAPSFLADEMPDIGSLAAKRIQEVHITLSPLFSQDTQLDPLKNLLFDTAGDCMVYFHVECPQGKALIKAHTSVRVPSSEEFLDKLNAFPLVESAWAA